MWGGAARGWGDPLHCPLADPLEYLGFPRMTWQKVSEDKVLGIHRYAKRRENGQCLREGSLRVPCVDTDGASGNRRVSERYVHREAGRKLEKMEAKGRLPSEKPGGLPQGGSPTYAPTLGSLTYPSEGKKLLHTHRQESPNPSLLGTRKVGLGAKGRSPPVLG